ncbi:MAG TPA: YfjI family protein, partial [Bacillales bacterium]|nr:YfjI family protein [Bacillales bacterium]
MITSSIPQQAEKIHESLNVLFNSGDVVEMRIPKAGKYRTISGYFDNGKALSEAAATYSGKYAGVYVTLNPVHKGLLARSNNKAASYAANTTSDNNILKRCWFYIDFDPKRPAGISSTDEEHAAAIERAKKVRDKLLNNGFPSPILADSGNGAHLLYRIDLPNDEESKTLITNCLKALDYHFSDQVVDIDIGVYNAARICKLYGTIACKGDNTEERPHREAKIINVPKPVEVVPKKHLKALANTKPKEPERTQNKRYESHGGGGSFDIEQYMTDHGLTISKEKAWQGGTVYELEECPFNPDHKKGDSSIIQFPGGAVSFQCFHNSCQGNDWHKLRDLLEGDHRKSYTKPYPQENFALEPTKLPGEPETPSLGAGMIPEPLRPWLIDVSERASIPLEFVAIPAIVALGSIIGRRIAIRPGRFDDWTVVPNLWGGIVGRPGVMKSYAVNEALKPVSRLAAKAIQDFEDKKAMAEAEEVEQKAEMDAIKKQMAKEAKKGGDTEALKAELAEKIKEINDCAITQKRYLIQDPTVEKLGELLQENPHGLLLSRDELSGWLRTLDKPGHEGDREFYLESWNGTGSFTFDRIGRGTTHIPAVCLSIIGGIQPGRLKSYITGALQANGSADDGLLQRLQLLVWPDKMGEWTNKELKPDKEAREQAFRLYEALETLTAEAAGATYDIDSELPFL